MSTVYVVHRPTTMNRATGEVEFTFDISPAEEYGELVNLILGKDSMLKPGVIRDILREKLLTFNDDDYLLAIGDPSIIAAAAMFASYFNHGRIKLLKYDRVQRSYIEVKINI